MARVSWTPEALDSLAAICEFIARDSRHYASIFAQRAFQLTDSLALHPESGRVVPEFRIRSLREILLGNYRIIYRFIDDQVQVLTVYHGARLMEAEDLPNA